MNKWKKERKKERKNEWMNEWMNDTDWKICVGLLGGNLIILLLFSTTNHTCNGLGLNPGFRSERPATNRLKHGTVFSRMTRLLWINEYFVALRTWRGRCKMLHVWCLRKPGELSYRGGCCKLRVPDRTRTPMIYAYLLGTKSLLCDEVYWLAHSLDLMSISVVVISLSL
jgi:hypothetical protein